MTRLLVCLRQALFGLMITTVLATLAATPARAQSGPVAPPEPAAEEVRKPPFKSIFAYGAVSFVELRGQDSTWSLAGVGAVVNASDSGHTTVEAQRAARPGLENWRGSVRHDEQLSADTSAYLQVSASTGDPLREDWGIAAGGIQRLGGQVQLTLDTRIARYSTPDPAARQSGFVGLAVTPGIVVSPRGTPLELSAQAIILRNDRKQWQAGGAVRALYYTGDRDFFIAGASRYPENELGIVRQLTAFHAGFRRELGQGIGLRFTAEQADLEGAWKARTLSIGLEKRF
ncbi:MAG TPA: YaiO family outer membrane beta-barrel protein [Erythrobacter sp.]|nr:YaiO family outer membrane beta-barrel protein [Erythrobacter sp.]